MFDCVSWLIKELKSKKIKYSFEFSKTSTELNIGQEEDASSLNEEDKDEQDKPISCFEQIGYIFMVEAITPHSHQDVA